MKSALVKCVDDTLGAQRRRSLGNTSIEREGHDQIAPRSRRRHCDSNDPAVFLLTARTGGFDPSLQSGRVILMLRK